MPAATEILAQLDAIDMLVGRSHECDWPVEQVTNIEILTKPNFTSSRSSRDIHAQVLSQTGSDLFSLDLEKLACLAPDLILTQSACHVCAVDVNIVNRAVGLIQQKKGFRSKVLAFSPQSIDDVFHDISVIATSIDRQDKAKQVISALDQRYKNIKTKTQKAILRKKKMPRVALIEWLDPPMSAGNWVPEMIQMAGATDALKADAGKSHWIDWADVAAADPDIVILIPCGFELERVLTEAKTPAVWPHLKDLRATREGKLFGVDGHHLFNRPGPRLVDSLEVLVEILHPESFQVEATARFAKRIEA